ncbi:putative ubiquinone biosynthesis monooxygenase [Lambiella insularis]|nr:putative ubiquinone biosynthesis monooxygenase [Lambiella insularis]
MRPISTKALGASYVCPSCSRCLRYGKRSYATAASATPELFDVVCVGGGPAGLSLLTALRSSPITSSLKLALVEAQDLSKSSSWSLPPDVYSHRASSLTPSSKAFLEHIGAWADLDHSRLQPYQRMQVWDGVSGARISFDWEQSPKISHTTVAYMTENANLLRALLTRLSSLSPIPILDKTSVSSISFGSAPGTSSAPDLSSWPHLTLSNSKIIASRLLVGADGINSSVRSAAAIPSRGWDYDRHGVVATVKLGTNFPLNLPRTAYQRFLPTGPIALLPLPGPYATLVWSTFPSHAAHLKSLSTTDLASIINAAFRLSTVDIAYMHTIPSGQASELDWRLQHTPSLLEGSQIPHSVISIQPDSVASFPLRLRHADAYTASRIALVGDAAHTIHPLAGQGLNMGLSDVEALVHNIEDSVRYGRDIGVGKALERYGADRYAANNRLLGVVDKLHKLYSVGSGPLVGLRSWGLEAVDKVGFIKDFFMKQAAGGAPR